MQNTHRGTQLIGRAALVALLAAPALGAQGRWDGKDRDQNQSRDSQGNDRQGYNGQRRLFTWRGTVDSDTRIYVRGGNVQSQAVNAASNANGRSLRGRR